MTAAGPDTPSAPVPLVVAAAVLDDLGRPTRLLAARRTAPPDLAGRWELPGGKVHPGEEPTDALHRELREELGIEVELGEEVDGPVPGLGWSLRVGSGPGGPWMRVWTAAVVAGEPRPLQDHDLLRWLPVEGVGPDPLSACVPWVRADEPVLDALTLRLDTRTDPQAHPRPRCLVVLPDRGSAEQLRREAERALRLDGLELYREQLAGDDDADDAQWVVVVPAGAAYDPADLEQLAEDLEGWVERP